MPPRAPSVLKLGRKRKASSPLGLLSSGGSIPPSSASLKNSHERRVKLLMMENVIALARIPASSTITFFDGDVERARKYFSNRLEEIISLNPWLLGRLEGRMSLSLVYEENGDDGTRSPLLSATTTSAKIHRGMSLADLTSATKPLLVRKGAKGGSGDPLFRVHLVPDTHCPTTRFSLVVSMSHIIGDGYTFYRVYNMLSSEQTVVRLDATRRPDLQKAIDAAVGRENTMARMARKPGVVVPMACGMLRSQVIRNRVEARMFYIDQEWVDEQKRLVQADDDSRVPYVSTNDVITSWFFRRVQADVGFMAVNFRGRIEDAGDAMCGNYEGLLVYRPPDFEEPSLIRESLSTMKRAANPPTKLPSAAHPIRKTGRMCGCTNWSSFCATLELPSDVEATQTLHIPLYDLSGADMPSNVASCIIFRPSQGKIACMLYGYGPSALRSVPHHGEIIGEPICI